jgi:hypothetical protein
MSGTDIIKLSDEYEKCLIGLTSMLKYIRNTATNEAKQYEKIQMLLLMKDLHEMKLEFLKIH